MTLTSACLRTLPCLPVVAAWAILPRRRILDRLTLAVCRRAYP